MDQNHNTRIFITDIGILAEKILKSIYKIGFLTCSYAMCKNIYTFHEKDLRVKSFELSVFAAYGICLMYFQVKKRIACNNDILIIGIQRVNRVITRINISLIEIQAVNEITNIHMESMQGTTDSYELTLLEQNLFRGVD